MRELFLSQFGNIDSANLPAFHHFNLTLTDLASHWSYKQFILYNLAMAILIFFWDRWTLSCRLQSFIPILEYLLIVTLLVQTTFGSRSEWLWASQLGKCCTEGWDVGATELTSNFKTLPRFILFVCCSFDARNKFHRRSTYLAQWIVLLLSSERFNPLPQEWLISNFPLQHHPEIKH